MGAVNLACAQSGARFNDNKIEMRKRRQPLNSLAATATNRSTMRKKKGDITAKLGRQFDQPIIIPMNIPRAIGEPQRGRRVARSAAKTSRHRDPLDQLDTSAELSAISLLKQLQ